MALTKTQRRQRIKNRTRKIVSGTDKQPRLAVFRSNKEIYAQLVNDVTGVTIAAASSRDKDLESQLKKVKNKTKMSEIVGKAIAKKAKTKKIGSVVLDRNGSPYHGRVKAFAESARKNGLEL